MIDPIAAKRAARWTRHELDDFFKGSARIQQEVKEQNPTLYSEYRAEYERLGGIGKSLSPNPVPYVKNYKPAPKQYSTNQLAARCRHGEAETRAYFADSKKSNEDFHLNRNLYEEWRESGVEYGMFDPRQTPYVPVKPVQPEPLHRLSDELARESNLPLGTELPWEKVSQLCEQKVRREREKQEAADAKVAADRQAELEKLTAAQKLEQAARDQKQRDLDRLQELIAPSPVKTSEPIQLATARLVEQEKAKQAA